MEKKVYENKSDKVIDFLIGFFLIPVVFGITSSFVSVLVRHSGSGPFISIGLFLAELAGAIYLGRKRKYIGIGLLFIFVVLPLVAIGSCLLVMGAGSILSPLFRR
jgi:hypothetical protein